MRGYCISSLLLLDPCFTRFSNPFPLRGLPLSRFSRRRRKDYLTACTSWLHTTRVSLGFLTPSHCEDFPYLASLAGAEKITLFYTSRKVVYFCSSARGELSPMATEGWEKIQRRKMLHTTRVTHDFTTPSHCVDFPYLASLAGAEKVTLFYATRKVVYFCSSARWDCCE